MVVLFGCRGGGSGGDCQGVKSVRKEAAKSSVEGDELEGVVWIAEDDVCLAKSTAYGVLGSGIIEGDTLRSDDGRVAIECQIHKVSEIRVNAIAKCEQEAILPLFVFDKVGLHRTVHNNARVGISARFVVFSNSAQRIWFDLVVADVSGCSLSKAIDGLTVLSMMVLKICRKSKNSSINFLSSLPLLPSTFILIPAIMRVGEYKLRG